MGIANIDKINWIIEQHEKTNHLYDGDLPYSFHLNLVVKVSKEFKHLIATTGKWFYHWNEMEYALWGHDLIEDARVTYNDIVREFDKEVADLIYAVTNEKGRNRQERANDAYYEGIRTVDGAVFIKLCDRIANVRYGKLVNSRMVDVYRRENDNFCDKLLGCIILDEHPLKPMFIELANLLK